MRQEGYKMQTWTVSEMLENKPCEDYPRERLVELWAGRERLSVLDILDLDIPAADRVWAALQAGPHVPVAVEAIVRRAVEAHALHCGIAEVEAWAARWLSGEDRSEAAAWAARAVLAAGAAAEAWVEAWTGAAARAAEPAAWAVKATAHAVAVEVAVAAQWAAESAVEEAAAAVAAEEGRQIEDIRSAVQD
jgi:hypothetical protein